MFPEPQICITSSPNASTACLVLALSKISVEAPVIESVYIFSSSLLTLLQFGPQLISFFRSCATPIRRNDARNNHRFEGLPPRQGNDGVPLRRHREGTSQYDLGVDRRHRMSGFRPQNAYFGQSTMAETRLKLSI